MTALIGKASFIMLAVQEEERKRKNEEYAKKATLVPELAADVENAVDAAWKREYRHTDMSAILCRQRKKMQRLPVCCAHDLTDGKEQFAG